MKRIFQKPVGRSLLRRLMILFAFLPLLVGAQDIGNFSEITSFPENSWFLVQTNHVVGLRFTRKINSSNLVQTLSGISTWPSANNVTATNTSPTNSTTFSVFWRKVGNVFMFENLVQGTNIVMYRDANSNIVINATGTGGGGGGGNLQTNANQFAANTVLSIISGALVTNISSLNITNRGSLTNAGTADFAGIGHFYSNLNIDGTLLTSGVLQVGSTANLLSAVNITGRFIADGTNNVFSQDLTIGSNNVVNGTNISRWLKLTGGQTASRALVLDANTNVVAASGTPDGTKFLRDDNTYAVPPGDVSTANLLVNSNITITASNKFQTDVSNLQGGTNGLNSGLSGVITRAVTNNHTVPVTLETNLNVRGRATNENGLVIWNGGNPAVRIHGTNGGVPSLLLQDYGSAFPYIGLQNAGGTAASPLADTVAGDVVGTFEIAAFGGSIYKGALSFRPIAAGTFSDSSSPTLVRVGIGNPAGTASGRAVLWWTSENITNDANFVVKSNVIVDGSALIGGSLTGGSILSQGILSAVDTVTANTNAHVLGTNRARWLKLDGGQTASSLLRLDGNTNVVAASIGAGLSFDGTTLSATGGGGSTDYTGDYGITNSTHIGINQSRQGVTNFLRTVQAGNGIASTNEGTNIVFAIDTAVTATQTDIANTLTNANSLGVSNSTSKPVFLRKNNRMIDYFTLVSGPNVTLTMSPTNSIVIDAPSSALSDGDKGDITVSGSGATWTIDNDTVDVNKMQEIAGFSVFAKIDTGTGNPTVATAGTDTVFGRNGSGNLGFAQLASGQIAANAVTFSKFQQFTSGRLFGRGSAATGNGEEITPSAGLTMSAGALTLDIGSTLVVSNTAASSVDNTLTRWDGTGGRTIQGSGAVLSDAGALSGLNTISATTSVASATIGGNVLQGMSIIASNSFKQQIVSMGGSTNIVLDYASTNVYWVSPSNVFTITLNNVPAAANYQKIELILVNTNSTVGYFPTNGMNFGTPVMLSAPSTNWYTFHVWGQNLHFVQNHQDLTTGIPRSTVATNVLNDSPYIVTPTNYNATLAGQATLAPSSGSTTVLKPSASSASVTNVLGVLHKSISTPLELDANAANRFTITNRVTAATTLILTNTSDGQEISVTLLGEASGGASRVITLIPQLGHLVANLDTYGTALAKSTSFTLTNGNAAEISWAVSRMNGTNVAKMVTRQFSF